MEMPGETSVTISSCLPSHFFFFLILIYDRYSLMLICYSSAGVFVIFLTN